jgi:SNF2 family DNA or RNA helicase
MEIISNTALKLTVPEHIVPHVKGAIERCEVIETRGNLVDLVIYWGVDEMTRLNQLIKFKNPLPSPISRDYNYPGIYKPFDHQRITAEFLSINHKAFCFNEAGTGKTSSVIWAIDYLMNLGKIKRVLVICPLSIMYSAWQGDIFNTAIHRTSAVAYGTSDKRRKIINGEYEFIIINFDGVAVVKDEIEKAKFDLIVIDEANAYKSVTTSRWKIMNKIVKRETKLWMLTGTPASQSPEDAFGIARLVCPQNVPKFKTAWRDKVMHQITRFKWIPKHDAKKEVFRVLQPAIRFAKNDCLDLPEVMYQTRDIPLTPQVEKYYQTLKKQMIMEASGESVTAVNAAAGA